MATPYTNIKVVAQGNLFNWATNFSNPRVNFSFQVDDFLIIMTMSNGALSAYNPSGFTRVGNNLGSSLTLFYRKITAAASSVTVSGLSGSGDVRYIVVRGAESVIATGETNGIAKNIPVPNSLNLVVITTGNSGGSEFRNAGYTVLPSSNWPGSDYYTMAWKEITSSFNVPQHGLWGYNENYLVLSRNGDYWVEEVTNNRTHVLSGEDIEVSWRVWSEINGSNEAYVFNSNYDLEVDTGSGWVSVAKNIHKDIRKYTYTVPVGVPKYNTAAFRVRSKDIDQSHTQGWVVSPTFVIDQYKFVIKSEDKFYTYISNNWVEISGVQDKEWFYEHGMGELDHILESKWGELIAPVSLVSFTNSNHNQIIDVTIPEYRPIYMLKEKLNDELTIRSSSLSGKEISLNHVANPHGQLIVQKEDITLSAPTIPRLIKKITFKGETVGTQTANRRIVISVDKGKSFYTWNNSKWEVLPEISKDAVQTIGMTVEEVKARTEEDWHEVFGNKPRHVRFAYYLEMDLFSDQLSIDEVELLMDITGSWQKASKKDYEYAYPNDEVLQVELFQDGYYKINY